MLAHVLLHESDGIVSMSWNCPDFLVEDSTESDADSDDNVLPLGTTRYPEIILRTSTKHPQNLQKLLFSLVCLFDKGQTVHINKNISVNVLNYEPKVYFSSNPERQMS